MSRTTVAVVRCRSYDPAAIDESLTEVFRLLGGASRFIKRDEKVLLKPNLLCAAPADEHATTHPEMIAGMIRQVLDVSGRPFLAESPAFGSLDRVAEVTGVAEILKRYHVPAVEISEPIHLPVKSPLSDRWMVGNAHVAQADVIINLPKLKAHTQARMTAAVKNLFGCVPGKRKMWWHVQAKHDLGAFCDMLVENARAVDSTLSVVDAVTAMEGQGPRHGTPRSLGLIVAGADPVAVDAVLCAIVGLPPERYEILQAARRRGIGTSELSKIQVVGESVDRVRVNDFKLPDELTDISFNLPRAAKSALRQAWLRVGGERFYVSK